VALLPARKEIFTVELRKSAAGRVATAAFATVLLVSACSSSAASTAPSAAASAAPSAAPTAAPTAAPSVASAAPSEAASAAPKHHEVAYLSASTANTWLAASKTEMDKLAAANDITITVFDAQFKADAQHTQMQDVIASGKYDAALVVALDGVGLTPDLKDAIAKGIKIVGMNQVIGPDFTTANPQVPGISAMVFEPPLVRGQRIGKLVNKACEGIDPCRVVYFFGIKGIPLDTAVRQGFDATIAKNVKVVDEREGQYLGPDAGQKAMQDSITATKGAFDVVVGADQSMQGAQLAIADANLAAKTKIIGFGGSKAAYDAIKSGAWWGDEWGAPATEGQLAMQAIINALNGKDDGGVDPGVNAVDDNGVTKDNIDKFTAQWAG
jgi:ribose transport system substrate-binding protein